MGVKKFVGCYSLPKDYQEKMWGEYGFDAARHDGRWMLPQYLPYGAIAVMKAYTLDWDVALPRITELMNRYRICIAAKMNYMEVVFYKPE